MARYLSITPQQTPFDLKSVDASGRVQLSFNCLVEKTESVTFEEEIVRILVTAGVGVFGSTIFSGSGASLPPQGTILTLSTGGGTSGRKIQNQIRPAYLRPSIQVIVHGVTYASALQMAWAAYNALAVVNNQTVVP